MRAGAGGLSRRAPRGWPVEGIHERRDAASDVSGDPLQSVSQPRIEVQFGGGQPAHRLPKQIDAGELIAISR